MDAGPDVIDISRRPEFRRRLGIAPDEVVVAAPGRVHRRSGHRFAVWAASILEMAELPVRLVIRHTGPAARDVAAFARVTGFGRQVILAEADWATADLLAAADVAVFLDADDISDGPTASMVAAMSAGLPIVAGNVAPTRDWFTDGRNALLVRPDRPREIARALMKIIEDKSLAEGLGASARSAVAKGLE